MEFSAKSRKTALQSHPSGPNVKKQLSSIPASVFSQKIAQLAFIWSHKQTNMLQFMTDFCHLYNYIIYWYILHFIIGYCRSRAYRPPLTLESLRCFLLNSAPRGLAQWWGAKDIHSQNSQSKVGHPDKPFELRIIKNVHEKIGDEGQWFIGGDSGPLDCFSNCLIRIYCLKRMWGSKECLTYTIQLLVLKTKIWHPAGRLNHSYSHKHSISESKLSSVRICILPIHHCGA